MAQLRGRRVALVRPLHARARLAGGERELHRRRRLCRGSRRFGARARQEAPASGSLAFRQALCANLRRMFTGIVQAVGRVVSTKPLVVDSGALAMDDLAVGDSICVQGVCLTVTAIRQHGFSADVSEETLRVTTGLDRPGAVNLEKSLAVGDKLGGHLVAGHVDGIGEVAAFAEGRLSVKLPGDLVRYVARKGSICIDGVSLTVNRVEGTLFEVQL